MASVSELLTKFQSSYGEKVGQFGAALHECERVPTGFFPFDLATGGGFPRGRASIIFGPESSGKTNAALRAIAMHQHIWPDKTCVFFDIEGGFQPAWAKALGVDVDKLIVIRPDYAEQVVDMVENFLYASDIGVVVVDSLAAMVTTQEADSSAEKAVVGGAALAIGKLVRKSTLAMQHAEREGYWPTLIYINQIRFKIGVMFGNPEAMPGGNAPKYQSAMTVRVYGNNIMDNKVSKTKPVRKHTSFVIKKWKVPIVAVGGEYEMATVAHKGLAVGEVDDWNSLSSYLRDHGFLEKTKTGWRLFDETYPTLTAAREKVYTDRDFGLNVRNTVIQKVLQEGVTEGEADEV